MGVNDYFRVGEKMFHFSDFHEKDLTIPSHHKQEGNIGDHGCGIFGFFFFPSENPFPMFSNHFVFEQVERGLPKTNVEDTVG